jgi:hypothetical protein
VDPHCVVLSLRVCFVISTPVRLQQSMRKLTMSSVSFGETYFLHFEHAARFVDWFFVDWFSADVLLNTPQLTVNFGTCTRAKCLADAMVQCIM